MPQGYDVGHVQCEQCCLVSASGGVPLVAQSHACPTRTQLDIVGALGGVLVVVQSRACPKGTIWGHVQCERTCFVCALGGVFVVAQSLRVPNRTM